MTDAALPPATRTEALHRLQRFLPHTGRDYAARRNHDLPGHPHVSQLSPFLRHRLITEPEVLQAVLARHAAAAAGKFVQEVVWRTYWKGWLEMRPGVWDSYLAGLDRALSEGALAGRLTEAEAGQTGIDCFDAWINELTTTGYLHNHARMWLASIWIFTLRLPWEAGADLFLRHLLDGDPASNTLSWRWVAGLHTRGKHYLARPDNIATYTDGRFRPKGLATDAAPLDWSEPPSRRAAPSGQRPDPALRRGLLLTEDDLSPGFLFDTLGEAPIGHAALISVAGRSPRPVAAGVTRFTAEAVADAMTRWAGRMGSPGPTTSDAGVIAAWAEAQGIGQVVTAHAPVGPAASALDRLETTLKDRGIALVRVLRDYDRAAWPHATHGFFRFKEAIPDLLDSL